MHPLDCLFSGWDIVDAVGFSEKILGLLGRFPRLILASPSDQWNAVVATLVAFTNDDGGVFACYEHIKFLVHCDAVVEIGCI